MTWLSVISAGCMLRPPCWAHPPAAAAALAVRPRICMQPAVRRPTLAAHSRLSARPAPPRVAFRRRRTCSRKKSSGGRNTLRSSWCQRRACSTALRCTWRPSTAIRLSSTCLWRPHPLPPYPPAMCRSLLQYPCPLQHAGTPHVTGAIVLISSR